MTPGFHRLSVADVRREASDAVSIALAVPAALRTRFAFAAGQYLTLRATIDRREVRRPYSIASGLDDGELRVGIRHLPGGRFSGFANAILKPGDPIEAMAPEGRFGVLPEPALVRHHVAFAAGAGITPILSLARTLLVREPRSRFTLFYGNRSRASIMFQGALEDLKDRYLDRLTLVHLLSRETRSLEALHGRLDRDKAARLLRAAAPAGAIDHAFVCGPAGMIAEVEAALAAHGVPAARLHVERFTPAPDAPPPTDRPAPAPAELPRATAALMLNGVRTEIAIAEGEAVVDAAIRAGLDVPWSCRGGMCCSCRARLVEGEVEMTTNYSLEPWELEAGYVLTCQAHPRSERLVIDYDQV